MLIDFRKPGVTAPPDISEPAENFTCPATLIYLDARSKKLGTELKGLERMIIFCGALVTVWAFVALTNKT